MKLEINGRAAEVGAESRAPLRDVVKLLELRGDRIAVELNGEIVPRTEWAAVEVKDGDRLEVVHFVGGGWGR